MAVGLGNTAAAAPKESGGTADEEGDVAMPSPKKEVKKETVSPMEAD